MVKFSILENMLMYGGTISLIFRILTLVILDVYFSIIYLNKIIKILLEKLKLNHIYFESLIIALICCIPKFTNVLALNELGFVRMVSFNAGSSFLSNSIILGSILLIASRSIYIPIHGASRIFFSLLNAIQLLIVHDLLEDDFIFMWIYCIIFFYLVFPAIFITSKSTSRHRLTVPYYNGLFQNLEGKKTKLLVYYLFPLKLIFDYMVLETEILKEKDSMLNLLLSPLVNFLIWFIFFDLTMDYKTFTKCVCSSMFVGVFLLVCSKFRKTKYILFAYSLIASSFVCFIISKSFVSTFDNFSKFTGVGKDFISGAIFPWVSSISEIVIAYKLVKNGFYEIAVVFILILTIIYIGTIHSTVLPYLSNYTLYRIIQNTENLPMLKFLYVFNAISMFQIGFNYFSSKFKFTKDLGVFQLITYALFFFGFILDKQKFYRE